MPLSGGCWESQVLWDLPSDVMASQVCSRLVAPMTKSGCDTLSTFSVPAARSLGTVT